ncbi:translation initiation factor IF-3 [[Mycoplasma] mobile]|uniref:Translation initiation factor IF-3 n=1 Tax=Mycoplasma mobile (strain ATCC 43663 / 163K / NCTC 11711) TaxID=267748 RepID=Q6KH16_MYCM1|nr:translation initiation factor IF-3 [[Mycoplasma] mobile]AAT28115.1 translation initiation factor if-3 [Mycoplasma mobile 163K]
MPKPEHYINENIPFKKVFVVDSNNEKLGVLTKQEALDKAKAENLDLVLISVGKSEKGEPRPIVRILDYGLFKYDRKKKQKELKEKQTIIENREIRLTPNIGDHDIKFKAKKAREFLMNGDRLKISLKFRGREKTRQELGHETLEKFIALLDDIAQVTKEATFTGGKFLDVFLQQDKKKAAKFLKENKNINKLDNEEDNDGKEQNEAEEGFSEEN